MSQSTTRRSFLTTAAGLGLCASADSLRRRSGMSAYFAPAPTPAAPATYSLQGNGTAYNFGATTGLSDPFLSFTGTEYIETPTWSNMTVGDPVTGFWTIACWFRAPSFASQFTWYEVDNGVNRVVQALINNTDGGQVYYRSSANVTALFSSSSGPSWFTPDAWHLIWATCNGQGYPIEIWVDGVLRSSGGGTIHGGYNMTNPGRWGMKRNVSQIFNGDMAGGVVWDYHIGNHFNPAGPLAAFNAGPGKISDSIPSNAPVDEWWVG